MIRKALLVTMAASMLVAATGCGNQQKAAETKAAETKAAEEKDGEKKEETTAAAETKAHAKGEYQLKIGTVVSGDHAWVKMADFMAKELNDRSNGAIEVSVAPGAQLGNDEAMFDDMRLGTLDMVIGGTQNAAPFVSQYQILAMPYLFDSRDQFESILS